MMKFSAGILSGGLSRRMNYKNKAFLTLSGETFIELIIKKLCNFDELFIISNDEETYRHLNIRIVKDNVAQLGPLGGIMTGLEKSSHGSMLIVPCDMPFLDQHFLEYLAYQSVNYDACVPKVGEFYEPLCAVYSQNCLPLFSENLKAGMRKISSLYTQMNINFICTEYMKKFTKPEIMFTNINSIDDYNKFCIK